MATQRLLVLDVVGLTSRLLEHAPRIRALAERGFLAPMDGVLPGVTCTAQATLLTGAPPSRHGIVGNGWYFRDLAEIWLWRQSNALVQERDVVDALVERESPLKVAKMFWWYNLYSSAQISATPRPQYPADGRKIPDVATMPTKLRRELQEMLGPFPLFQFWGPTASIVSTRWIADASLHVLRHESPELLLVYLPHLDYDLQRYGPDDARIPHEVRAVDAEAGKLIDAAQQRGDRVIVLSEYGITKVSASVEINRRLRERGLLEVRETDAGEILDPGSSRAFAVADHQIAHVYVRDAKDRAMVQQFLQSVAGIEQVLDEQGKKKYGLDHERSGELVAISTSDRSFAYHYWLDDRNAPDFAHTVDIHRKPGYDPSELFFDPDASLLKMRLGFMLLRKKLGFRTLMRAISLRSDLARGSHGRLPDRADEAPIYICSSRDEAADRVEMQSVRARMERLLNV